MKTRIAGLALLGFVSVSASFGQSSGGYTQNAVFVELGGQGFLYSINYDHRFTQNFAVRAGFSTFTIEFFSSLSIMAVPLMAEYLVGDGSHHLELGFGIVPVHGEVSGGFFGTPEGTSGGWIVVWSATVGYRFQPRTEGLLFRAGLTPFFFNGQSAMWGGFTLGYAF